METFDSSPLYIHLDDRFADRDMLVRYHWRLGIGHVYSHEDDKFPPSAAILNYAADGTNEIDDEDSADRQNETLKLTPLEKDADFENEDNDNPELGMGVRDDDDFSDQSSSDSESQDSEEEAESDEERLELMESYYTDY